MEVLPASQERIAEFRKKLDKPLNDCRNELDERDFDRIMNEDTYTALFIQWTRSETEAVDLAVKCLKWRKINAVNDISIESIGEETFKQGYLFLLGKDTDGGRVLHLQAGRMKKADKEKNTQLLIFWLERIQRKEPGKRVSFILDTTGSGIGNSDMGFTKFIIECFTSYFPCMLRRTLVYNLPSILNAMWKLISKMLSKDQSDVTVLCGKSDIVKYVSVENLPVEMGGQIDYKYSYPPFPDDLDA